MWAKPVGDEYNVSASSILEQPGGDIGLDHEWSFGGGKFMRLALVLFDDCRVLEEGLDREA